MSNITVQSESEYVIVASGLHSLQFESTIFFGMQQFVKTVVTCEIGYTMLESCFERLCKSLSPSRPETVLRS